MGRFHDATQALAKLTLSEPVRVMGRGELNPILCRLLREAPKSALESWVVKPAHGTIVLRELIAADLASLVGIRVPESSVVAIPSKPLLGPATVHDAWGHVVRRFGGQLAFCSRFVENACDYSGDADDGDLAELWAFDRGIANFDRSDKNPNCLSTTKKELVAIDHHLAFYKVDEIDQSGASTFDIETMLSEAVDDVGRRHVGAKAAASLTEVTNAAYDKLGEVVTHRLNDLEGRWPSFPGTLFADIRRFLPTWIAAVRRHP
jgi:hypothetical protein